MTLYVFPSENNLKYLSKILNAYLNGKPIEKKKSDGTWRKYPEYQTSGVTILPGNNNSVLSDTVRIGVEVPPVGTAWHNPHNVTLTEAEREEGWRLLLNIEIRRPEVGNPLQDKCQKWYSYDNRWLGPKGNYGACLGETYRTKMPLPKVETKLSY